MTRHAIGEAQQLRQLRAEIAAHLGRGDSLDSVERELIAPSRLTEEQQLQQPQRTSPAEGRAGPPASAL